MKIVGLILAAGIAGVIAYLLFGSFRQVTSRVLTGTSNPYGLAEGAIGPGSLASMDRRFAQELCQLRGIPKDECAFIDAYRDFPKI